MLKTKLATGLLALGLSFNTHAINFFSIGTGGVTGTYYPTGGAICRLVNKHKSETKMHCSVESTGGSVYNINTIKNGELDFGIAQSDVVYQAYNGAGKFDKKPYTDIRSVMAIYPELLALVVSKASGINTLENIEGKKINLGNPGSGNEATADILLAESDMSRDDLALAGVLKAQECPTALRDKKIDGYFYMVGHPTSNIQDAANSVDIQLIPIDGAAADSMIQKYPYFAKGIIPAGIYKNVNEDVHSVGVKAVLVTKKNTKDETVELVLRTILNEFENFKRLHPAYKTITKESLLEGLSAPLHPAAKKVYQEMDLMKN
ncbi:TAXI family TRAP transporter solute-binding subunit [Candidatus Albibeggiatoa sp. nov. NOAA]|uniref:TAXI family TRAP transporter solute-binding subunit n=1 Tax=Candidatus Albibeggiatoa sp. nov. NOAA TaxID=3162724 RepID=UPI0032FD940A|nr:TAXI family TRAP transporter solute-binding subunit [Thiotrichaceae bacterium]